MTADLVRMTTRRKLVALAALGALMLLAPAVSGANDWAQWRYDAKHQGSVPAGFNSEFGPFKAKWWGNLSIPGPVGSPSIRSNIVYFGGNDGRLYAFDQESGGLIQSNTTGSRIPGAPAVGPGFVYVVNEGGSLYSFERTTLVVQKGYPLSVGTSTGTFRSVVLDEDTDTLIVGGDDGVVRAYFASTQEPLWTFTTAGSGPSFFNQTCSAGRIDGTPVVFEQWVLFGSTNHCFFAVLKNLRGAITTPVWIFKSSDLAKSAAIRSSPTIDADAARRRVIFTNNLGYVFAVPLSSSGAVFSAIRSYLEPPEGGRSIEIISSPAIAGDKVVIAARNGNVSALSLSDLSVAWVRNVGGAEITSSPAVANNHILVGSFDGNMFMLHLSNGTVMDQRTASSPIESSAAISGTQGFWGAKDGALYSFGGNKPARPDLAILSVDAGSPVQGQGGSIRVRIQNLGLLPTGKIVTARVEENTKLLGEVQVPALEANQTYDFSVTYTPTTAGSFILRVFVDSTRLVQEADESNNEKTQPLSVASPPPPVEPGAGGDGAGGDTKVPGFEAAGLAMAFALLFGLLGRRRRPAESG